MGHTGRFARWLLLACTLFGLAVMHTVGHAGMQMHAHDHPGAQASSSLPGPTHDFGAMGTATTGTVATFVTSDICDGGCAHAPSSSPHGGGTGWSVCLAVLGALAMVVVLIMLGARFRRRGPPTPDGGTWAAVNRGPPVKPVGLALATVSVLRV